MQFSLGCLILMGFMTEKNINIYTKHDKNYASDRETIELLKSFKRIKDHVIRKRMTDLLRSISLKDR